MSRGGRPYNKHVHGDGYFIYALFKDEIPFPFYIGYGSGVRAICSKSLHNADYAYIIVDNLTKSEAKALESEITEQIGRRNTGDGPLINRKSCDTWSQDMKDQWSHRMRGAGNPRYGKPACGGQLNTSWRKGRKASEEVKKKMSKAHLGKKLAESTKQKMSDSQKGRTKNQEYRDKISKGLKLYYQTHKPHNYRQKGD